MKSPKTRFLFPVLMALALLAPPMSVPALAGSLLVASTTPINGITGHAYDVVNNTLYRSTDFGTTLVGPGGALPVFASGSLLDLAFANGFVWAGESNFNGGVSVARIDPASGAVLNEYDLGLETVAATGPAYVPPFSPIVIPFMALGVAWDGSGFWFSNNAFGSPDTIANGVVGTSVEKFLWDPVLDTLTAVPGSAFTPFMDTWTIDPASGVPLPAGGRTPGGLAWDVIARRLLIGTDSGQIYSWDPANPGAAMSLVLTTADGGFVQGLETVPEPATFLLLGVALLGFPVVCRWRRK